MAFAEHAVTGRWLELGHDGHTQGSLEAAAPSYSSAGPATAYATIDTVEGLAALETDWNELFSRAGHSAQIFQQYNWCHHWARHFLPGQRQCRLAIVTGRENGRLVTLWPLVMTRRAGLSELSWLGRPVSQYGDVLIEAGPQRQALLRDGWRFITKALKPDFARLVKTRADSTVAPLLAELGARTTQTMSAPYLDLKSEPSWVTFEARYGSKALRNRRRQFRRLEERGPVSFNQYSQGPQAAALAREAVLLKRAWLAAKGLVSPAITNDRTLEFFATVASDTAWPSGVRVFALSCGGEQAAIGIGFVCGDRIAVHIIVYALAYQKAAAGALLLERSMKASLEAGIGVYDMLAPGGGYKTEWTNDGVGVHDFALALSPAGRIYVRGYLEFVRPQLKLLATRLGAHRLALQTAVRRWTLGPKTNPHEVASTQ